jgi:hypothetical protein
MEDMNTLLKQQLSVLRSSMGAVNNTSADVEYNESLLKERIYRITKYSNTLKSETNEKMNLFSAKIRIEGHILRVNSVMNALQCNLDLLIGSVISAQKGVSKPQVISPVNLMEALIKSVSAFPKDTALPFPLSKGSAHILHRLCDLEVYIKNGMLGYIILLTPVNRGNFNIQGVWH